MLKWFKKLMLLVVVLVVLFVVGVVVFIYTAPQFGQSPEGEDLNRIQKSTHYQEGGFVNLIETQMNLDWKKMPALMWSFLNPPKGKNPVKPLPTEWDEGNENKVDSLAFFTWYGHSAFMLEWKGRVILIDPMLGESSSPVSFMTKRFAYEEAIQLDEIPKIDAIIISHDHYDHLDYSTIIKLKDKTEHFYTALGVGSHLKRWGVKPEAITELDWWELEEFKGIQFVATPSRHFSGRGITDRNKTQWASWIIKDEKQSFYFSGDGGYGPHFKEIGEKYGPFDFAMIECGQYNEQWEAIHMMPEQSVQAGIDVQGKVLMPIHWGAFDLAPHVWDDPILRFTSESKKKGADYITPLIGERFAVGVDRPQQTWWKSE